jgi:signal transduction histidine kinase
MILPHLNWPNRLYLRIYLTLLVVLILAAGLFGMVWNMHPDSTPIGPSLESFSEIAGEVLPPASAPRTTQQAALDRWRQRMHADLALYAPSGDKIASSGRELPPWKPSQTTSGWLSGHPPVFALQLPDQRWLVGRHMRPVRHPFNLIAILVFIALALAVGAYPIARRLTRRLENLQTSVEALGAGQLSTRVVLEGHDEVARLAASFNRSAERIEELVSAQKKLLANASHELRSPLARIRMAVELMSPTVQSDMRDELARNIGELDQLIDEILLASRLDATEPVALAMETVDLTALVAEECARVDAQFHAQALHCQGDPRLLRRLVRNLLENARRHGNHSMIEVVLEMTVQGIRLDVSDSGPGVPVQEWENIFTPFYRVPGTRERDGGVGLGLSLVRQIARKHCGDVVYLSRNGPGSCFRVTLPP